MKFAIIFPGNLACYFISLNNLQKICLEHDIDIYILYSKNINYIHTLVSGNKYVNVHEEDIQTIEDKLKHHIKFCKSIEDIVDYNNIINEKINLFQKNILWTKELEEKQLSNFTYDSFMNDKRTQIYLDQFVRINYLYKIIESSQIKYDYIIRARIDQYIDYDILNNIIISLTNNTNSIYPIVSSAMDNFFIVGKTHFGFFDYLINNIGTEKLNYINKELNFNYILGPEYQFNTLVNNFFTKIFYFNDFNVYFEITFGIIDFTSKCIFLYRCKNNNGICFAKYIGDKEKIIGTKMNKTNYLQFLENNKNIIKIDLTFNDILNKYYSDIPMMFYSIVI